MGVGVGLGVVLGKGDGVGLASTKPLDVPEGFLMRPELPLEDDGRVLGEGVLNRVSWHERKYNAIIGHFTCYWLEGPVCLLQKCWCRCPQQSFRK